MGWGRARRDIARRARLPLVALYFFVQAQQAADRIAELSNIAPLRETVVVRAQGPSIVHEMQALSKLETSKYTIEKILDAERTRQYVPEFLAGETLIFVAHGEVVGGLDLSKLKDGDVRISGASVVINLPEPEILYSRVDNEKSYVYSRDTGLLSDPDKDLESQVRAEAEQQIRDDAVEDGILDEARANGERSLKILLGSMGYTDVRFE
ncbi:MAG: DUF4230 domain-containing protein [Chloroflexia bacterium]